MRLIDITFFSIAGTQTIKSRYSSLESMRTLCFTIDLDRDVNNAVSGSSAAISIDRGCGSSPRFESSKKGTEKLVELLDEMNIKATFFAEARTLSNTHIGNFLSGQEIALHGLDHEDFTGTKTGIQMEEGEMREIIERAISMIRDEVGYQPSGFRTPYMDPNEILMEALPEYGIRYDSSYYAYLQPKMLPYRHNGMLEIPVLKGRDEKGKNITSYLWPMHEGNRSSSDFIAMGKQLKEGVFVLATHSWHIVEGREKGIMDDDAVKRNISNVRAVLEGLMDEGYILKTMSDVSKEF